MLYMVGARGKLGSGLMEFLEAKPVSRSLRELDSLSHRDVVVNAAGLVMGSCATLREANVFFTQRVLERVEDAGAFLIHISSIAVYGDRNFGEDFNPYSEAELKAKDCYGITKIEGERVLRGRAAILRLGPVFGPTFPIYAKLLRFLQKYRIAPLIGKGTNVIPFTYIKDVVKAVKEVMARREPVLEVVAGPGAEQRRVYEYAASLLGVEVSYLPLPHLLASIAARLLGKGEYVKVLSRHRPFPPPQRLSLTLTPFPEALAEVVEAYRARDLL